MRHPCMPTTALSCLLVICMPSLALTQPRQQGRASSAATQPPKTLEDMHAADGIPAGVHAAPQADHVRMGSTPAAAAQLSSSRSEIDLPLLPSSNADGSHDLAQGSSNSPLNADLQPDQGLWTTSGSLRDDEHARRAPHREAARRLHSSSSRLRRRDHHGSLWITDLAVKWLSSWSSVRHWASSAKAGIAHGVQRLRVQLESPAIDHPPTGLRQHASATWVLRASLTDCGSRAIQILSQGIPAQWKHLPHWWRLWHSPLAEKSRRPARRDLAAASAPSGGGDADISQLPITFQPSFSAAGGSLADAPAETPRPSASQVCIHTASKYFIKC